MGAVKKLPRPMGFPGRTVLFKKTSGPVAYMGEVVPDIHVNLGEQEVIEAVHALGLPTPQMYFDLEAGALQAADRIVELEAENAELRDQIAQQVRVVAVDDLALALSQKGS